MTDLANLTFFATQPHACSYLPDAQATTLFLDPHRTLDTKTYSQLSALGFRRSGDLLYRPHCRTCTACVPARIPVNSFTANRQQNRIYKRNADLVTRTSKPAMTEEIYQLFAQYITARHADGDMYPPSPEQFNSFLVSKDDWCVFHEFRYNGRLLAVAVTDYLENGLSAVYTFFDPKEERRSLGRYAILWQIQEARRLKLQAVYLGYWIKNSRKMNYKTEYRPLELLINQQWVLNSLAL